MRWQMPDLVSVLYSSWKGRKNVLFSKGNGSLDNVDNEFSNKYEKKIKNRKINFMNMFLYL
jgi:hypothetical protein